MHVVESCSNGDVLFGRKSNLAAPFEEANRIFKNSITGVESLPFIAKDHL